MPKCENEEFLEGRRGGEAVRATVTPAQQVTFIRHTWIWARGLVDAACVGNVAYEQDRTEPAIRVGCQRTRRDTLPVGLPVNAAAATCPGADTRASRP